MIKILSLLFSFLICITAQADTIFLKNGGKIDGIVKEKKDEIHVTLPYGTLIIPRHQIEKIVVSITPLDEYRQKLSLLQPKDIDSRYKLAMWCKENGLPQQYEKELRSVLAIDSDHEKARAALGYERYQNRWITFDESMALKGFIKHKGDWISPEKYYTILLDDFKKQLEEERLLRKNLQGEVNILQQRIFNLEDELSRLKTYVDQVAKEANKPRYIIYKKYWPYEDSVK